MRTTPATERPGQRPTESTPARAARLAPRSLWQAARVRLGRGELGPWPVLVGLAIIWLLFQSQDDRFLTARNLSNLILQIGVLGTLAIGVVLVLVVGEIDLSLGAVTGVSAAVLGILLADEHWSAVAAILATLALGAAIGLLQGGITVLIGVPSFIVTLAGFLAWGGVQIILLGTVGELLIQDTTVRSIASAYLTPAQSWAIAALFVAGFGWVGWRRRIRRRRAELDVPSLALFGAQLALVALTTAALTALLNAYFGVPYILVLVLALVVALTWLAARTVFGRHLYAIGGNAEAARRAGIHVGGVKVAVFTLTSTLAALGGILSASREFAVSTGTGGGTLLLDAIAAAVIGGTSLFGGRGRIYHAVLGALVIGSVENGLDLLGQPASVKDIATGIILVFAVGIDAVSRRRRQAG
jgi:D-xylose transport system permease protein